MNNTYTRVFNKTRSNSKDDLSQYGDNSDFPSEDVKRGAARGAGGGESDRRSQADLEPPFCDNGREGVCLSDWLIYGLLSSWTSFYRLFGCTPPVLQPASQPAGDSATQPPPPLLPCAEAGPSITSIEETSSTNLSPSLFLYLE
ncbi:hypothetical protein V1478_011324 [Vespula squamosa]|uniref:Uncharacterized protein n=1 Tax=Vespula squamosa TaxID=30214 RepID=A0ABD2AEF2_VESSQ